MDKSAEHAERHEIAEVRNTGQALLWRDSVRAVFLSRPRRMPKIKAETMWTESAMATVITMIGTPELAGLNTVPTQPANPTVVLMTNMSAATMARVPNTERRRPALATIMRRSTTGVRVCISFCVVSVKARFMTASPVR